MLDNGSPFGPFAETNCPALLLEYAQVYIVRLAMARLSGAAQRVSKLSYSRFLRVFDKTCSIEDYRMMAFVLEKELVAAADSASHIGCLKNH